ncbi:MAG: Trp family transcriptional regulator [Candidatus Berkelbacteria bacterium]|nr:Trp family transcriptional regulator [Candidatus Berkelbacteria bacterium]
MSKKGIDSESKILLIESLKKLKSDEFIDFLESLMSSTEIKNISRRTMAAKLLLEYNTYEDVELLMGMSPGTINKIHFKTKGSPAFRKLFTKKD